MSIQKYLDKISIKENSLILITGGTSGVGLCAVHHLLKKNCRVVILARNIEKANRITNDLKQKFNNAYIKIIRYDQSDAKIIKEACLEIKNKYSNFDALILNAGVFIPREDTEPKAIPLTIKTNYFGMRFFLENLRKEIDIKPSQRVVIQGSFVSAFKQKKIKSFTDKLSRINQYNISKASVEAYYHHLATTTDLNICLVEPGLTNSDIIRDLPKVIRFFGKIFLKLVSHSPKKAALTILKALDENTPNHSFIVPRGLFTFMGYPKYKKFTKKRERNWLVLLYEDND